MANSLSRDAERVSAPGEYRLHVRRLVALFAGLGILEIGILSGPTVYLTEGVNPIAAAMLLAPIVVLAVVIAGVATGTIYLRCCGRSRRDLLRRADRLLAVLLTALLGVYVAVACVLAATRLLPIAAPGDALARMHPMLGWYFVIAAAAADCGARRRARADAPDAGLVLRHRRGGGCGADAAVALHVRAGTGAAAGHGQCHGDR